MSAPVENVPTTDAAVTDVAATLADTSISGKADTKANDDNHASAVEGRRLYIGNLAYATSEGKLTEFFKGYLVERISIPKNPRTDRPVGYAFVDLSTPNEAERAIAELSGQEVLERKVSVQLARKPEPTQPKEEGANGEGAEGTRRSRSTRGRGRSGRGRGGAGRAGRSDNSNAQENQGQEGATDAQAAGTTDAEVKPLTDITNKNQTDKDEKAKKEPRAPREPRERRERGPPADGIASKTKVMVANLPYDMTEARLKEVFAAYEPVSAKIALRPIPRFMIKKLQARNEPRKGRGFGFVTLASEELQQKAVTEMNGKQIDSREIAVKVAIDSPDKTDDDVAQEGEASTEANGTETAAPAVEAASAAATDAAAAPAAAPAAPATTA
ncbi:hypothetical protein M0657_007381 [Pyricularia oryzae]|uniref:RRM domain-containing protein n=3 Tax=Pyricularia oryzae TaxID=318829 RepID=A0A4V1C5J3_PYROR|nr:hypothetical protein OOU_Y34scaffold00154g1 [Pyricularia oryzae Y34]KAI7912250.1 hypothetical protein M9X92_010123 [Pyricularia oryzae]KAI7918907.1 hypothetical protein M0657_007381 [Pyricularia oryzae]QBZ56585.1 hypothetical protein PoMZ_01494 [Pyricularia oryzae]